MARFCEYTVSEILPIVNFYKSYFFFVAYAEMRREMCADAQIDSTY